MKRDTGLRPDDYVFVLLDPYAQEKEGYAFQVNANGTKVDTKIMDYESGTDSN